jgi:hypothetical protein
VNNGRSDTLAKWLPSALLAIGLAAFGMLGLPKCADLQTKAEAAVQIQALADANERVHSQIFEELQQQRIEARQQRTEIRDDIRGLRDVLLRRRK